ncbi:hypothetical protein Tco_0623118 [Tanacetum coccineum]
MRGLAVMILACLIETSCKRVALGGACVVCRWGWVWRVCAVGGVLGLDWGVEGLVELSDGIRNYARELSTSRAAGGVCWWRGEDDRNYITWDILADIGMEEKKGGDGKKAEFIPITTILDL